MGYIDNLSSMKGKKGMFTIILTATILTIFEIVLFYVIITPDVSKQMTHNINKIGDKIANNINDTNKVLQMQGPVYDVTVSQITSLIINDTNDNILTTCAEREKKLIDQINNYTIYTGVAILLILSFILYTIWSSISNDPRIGGLGIDENDSMQDAILTAFLTVGILIGFQILFYLYGKQYMYPGSLGPEELMNEIIDEIKPTKISDKINKD